jgi:hypothetical protein
VEADAGAKVEDVGEGVRDRPGFGEVAVKVHLVVAANEAAEEEAIDALRIGVGGEAGIEVGGVGFEEEGEGVSAAWGGAAEEKAGKEVKK